MSYRTITKDEATRSGFEPITVNYNLDNESHMLDGVIQDMQGVDFCLVGDQYEVAVWRKSNQINVYKYSDTIKALN